MTTVTAPPRDAALTCYVSFNCACGQGQESGLWGFRAGQSVCEQTLAQLSVVGLSLLAGKSAVLMRARLGCRMSRLLETWCLMEYAEKGSLADALRTGRLKRPGGFPELGVIIACLQDIASGERLAAPGQFWLTTAACPWCYATGITCSFCCILEPCERGNMRLRHLSRLFATMEDMCGPQQCTAAGSMCSRLLPHFSEELRLLSSPKQIPMPLTLRAAGMEYLHSAGILHGDLKPANVLLKSTSADRRGFLCKLCDFGMSRLLDATHATHVSTQTYGVSPYPASAARGSPNEQADLTA